MKDFYWRTEEGHSGLLTAPSVHNVPDMVRTQLDDLGVDPDEIEWSFTRVDDILEV